MRTIAKDSESHDSRSVRLARAWLPVRCYDLAVVKFVRVLYNERAGFTLT